MTRLNLNLRDLLVDALGESPARVAVDVDLDDLLAEKQLIAAVWSVPDVLDVRPDLSEAEAWEVLQRCHAEHDQLVGMCREVVARTADAVFGVGNTRRANRCQAVLATYNDEWDAEANLVDLLADARHWCDREERDYGKLDRLAHKHYLAELEGEQGGSHD